VVAAYDRPFAPEQAERLLWRAGFGPAPGQADALAKLGLDGAVHALTHPGRERLVGPAPHDQHGRPLAPYDVWGHDHLWWLDRMVRTSRPLVERMTLVWHDWFATSNAGVGSQRLMLGQNALFRRHSLGSFEELLLGVTRDPAMLLWLNGSDNSKWAPNENFGREMMELFTLGHGDGYGEDDVREQARSLTGFRNDWRKGQGPVDFRYDPSLHDDGVKRVFGASGRFNWQDACRLCVRHPAHAGYFVRRLWSYFVPTPPDGATEQALARIYTGGGRQLVPVLEAILKHPALYEGPRMVKPPVVQVAGMLRATGRGVDTDAWAWIGSVSGQQLFYPPNVAGWDDTRWLDTATFRGRWQAVTQITSETQVPTSNIAASRPTAPDELLADALRFWGDPPLSDATRGRLASFARAAMAAATQDWQVRQNAVLTANALRQLIAVSPDLQTA
jgi:uncharacterized protein (DUF1800 family)